MGLVSEVTNIGSHLRAAPRIFHLLWPISTICTLLCLLCGAVHTLKLVRLSQSLRIERKEVFFPTHAGAYVKIFMFFPLCSLLSWLSLIIIQFAVLFHLLLYLYEVACLVWFWQLMADFFGGPEEACKTHFLASSLPPQAAESLVATAAQIYAETASPATPLLLTDTQSTPEQQKRSHERAKWFRPSIFRRAEPLRPQSDAQIRFNNVLPKFTLEDGNLTDVEMTPSDPISSQPPLSSLSSSSSSSSSSSPSQRSAASPAEPYTNPLTAKRAQSIGASTNHPSSSADTMPSRSISDHATISSHRNVHPAFASSSPLPPRKPKQDVGCDTESWSKYLTSVRFGPYRVLGAFPFCCVPRLRVSRSFQPSDLRLSYFCMIQYLFFAVVAVLVTAVSRGMELLFQILSLLSLYVSMYGLLILYRATTRLIPKRECHLGLKFAVIKLAVFSVKATDIFLSYTPIVVGHDPPYGKKTMAYAWTSFIVNVCCLPIMLMAARAYSTQDLYCRYSLWHESRCGMLVSLLSSMPETKSLSPQTRQIYVKIRTFTPSAAARENISLV